jgi:hypothetical protein
MMVYKDFNFGERLQAVMRERHLNPSELARVLGYSHGVAFRMLKRKDIDTEKLRQVSRALEHDFVAEFGATSNGVKPEGAIEASDKFVALQNEVNGLKAKLAEQERLIEMIELEKKYLRELVEAYKKK